VKTCWAKLNCRLAISFDQADRHGGQSGGGGGDLMILTVVTSWCADHGSREYWPALWRDVDHASESQAQSGVCNPAGSMVMLMRGFQRRNHDAGPSRRSQEAGAGDEGYLQPRSISTDSSRVRTAPS